MFSRYVQFYVEEPLQQKRYFTHIFLFIARQIVGQVKFTSSWSSLSLMYISLALSPVRIIIRNHCSQQLRNKNVRILCSFYGRNIL